MYTSVEPPPITPRWTPLLAHPTRIRAATCTRRFIGIYAGRGSGKTEIAKRRLVVALRMRRPWPDARYFYGAPTEEQAKRIAWDDLLALTPKAWIVPGGVRFGDLSITTKWGSMLQVVGLDKPQRIEGPQWDGCVIDENSDIKPGTFNRNILPALTHRMGWAWRIGVPKRQGIGAREFREWCSEAEAGEISDRAVFTWRSADILDILNPEMLAYARDHMDPKDYSEQFDATWETAGGAIFHAFDAHGNKRPCPYQASMPIIVGADFNVDPMSWVLGHHYQEHRRIEWFDELWMRNANTQAALNAVWKRYAHHKSGWRFYLDAAGGQRRTSASETDYKIVANDQRFRDAGRIIAFPLITSGPGGTAALSANPPVSDRFASCNALFASGRMLVDPKCKRLLADLESRHYKPGTVEPADVGDAGHITDAMGYAVHAIYPYSLVLNRVASVVTTSMPTPGVRHAR